MAFLDRRVHKTVADFLNYLGQTMPVYSSSILCNTTQPNLELQHLNDIIEGDVLVLKLRDDFWQVPSHINLPQRDPN